MKPLRLMPSTLIFVSAAMLFGGDDPLMHSVSFGSCRIGVHYLLVYLRRAWSFHSTYYCRRDDASQRRGKFTKETFVERLRFRPMSRRDWRYSLLALVVIGLLTSGIMIAMQVLFSDFNHTPSFMTLDPLSPGRYWLLLAWFPYWLLNIGGEEFFWRGVLLPRQEKTFEDKTWILHGTGWAIFHIAFGWQLLVMLLPLLYIEPYVVQKTQNTWTGVFLHGVINGPSFIAIALGII